jgi:hypothetical protein
VVRHPIYTLYTGSPARLSPPSTGANGQKPQSEAEDERTKWNQALCGRAARLP